MVNFMLCEVKHFCSYLILSQFMGIPELQHFVSQVFVYQILNFNLAKLKLSIEVYKDL